METCKIVATALMLLAFIITVSGNESSPVCSSNMKSDGFVGPNTCDLEQENMTFNCDLSFSGQHPPSLTWSFSHENESRPFNSSDCYSDSNRINCNLTLKSDPVFDGSAFLCQTTAINGLKYNCSTEVIKVQYLFVDNDPWRKNVNETVSCVVRSNLDVNYNWKMKQGTGEYTLFSRNRTISIKNPGVYECEAEYSIRNVTCSALVSAVNLNVESDGKETATASSTRSTTQDTTRTPQGSFGLIEAPQNLAVYVGERMSFKCQTTNGSNVREWLFNKPSDLSVSSRQKIFAKWSREQDWKHGPGAQNTAYDVDVTETGAVELYVNDTQTKHAGTYICATEMEGTVSSYYAELIVLESEPECNVTLSVDKRIRGECSVVFSGSWTPKMEWRHHIVGKAFQVANVFKSGAEAVDYSNETHVMSTLSLTVLTQDAFTISCKVYFDRRNDHVGNVPELVYVWNSTVFGEKKSESTAAVTQSLNNIFTTRLHGDIQSSNNDYMTLMYIVFALGFALFLLMIGTLIYVIQKKKRKAQKSTADEKPLDNKEMKTKERVASGVYDTIQYDGIGYESLDQVFSHDGLDRGYETAGKGHVQNGYEEPVLPDDRKVVLDSQYITTSPDFVKESSDNEQIILSSQYITTCADPSDGIPVDMISIENSGRAKESNSYTPLYGVVGPKRKNAEKEMPVAQTKASYIEIIDDSEETKSTKESQYNQLSASKDGSEENCKTKAESAAYTQLMPETGYTPLVIE